jgi:hypothetical protein
LMSSIRKIAFVLWVSWVILGCPRSDQGIQDKPLPWTSSR